MAKIQSTNFRGGSTITDLDRSNRLNIGGGMPHTGMNRLDGESSPGNYIGRQIEGLGRNAAGMANMGMKVAIEMDHDRQVAQANEDYVNIRKEADFEFARLMATEKADAKDLDKEFSDLLNKIAADKAKHRFATNDNSIYSRTLMPRLQNYEVDSSARLFAHEREAVNKWQDSTDAALMQLYKESAQVRPDLLEPIMKAILELTDKVSVRHGAGEDERAVARRAAYEQTMDAFVGNYVATMGSEAALEFLDGPGKQFDWFRQIYGAETVNKWFKVTHERVSAMAKSKASASFQMDAAQHVRRALDNPDEHALANVFAELANKYAGQIPPNEIITFMNQVEGLVSKDNANYAKIKKKVKDQAEAAATIAVLSGGDISEATDGFQGNDALEIIEKATDRANKYQHDVESITARKNKETIAAEVASVTTQNEVVKDYIARNKFGDALFIINDASISEEAKIEAHKFIEGNKNRVKEATGEVISSSVKQTAWEASKTEATRVAAADNVAMEEILAKNPGKEMAAVDAYIAMHKDISEYRASAMRNHAMSVMNTNNKRFDELHEPDYVKAYYTFTNMSHADFEKLVASDSEGIIAASLGGVASSHYKDLMKWRESGAVTTKQLAVRNLKQQIEANILVPAQALGYKKTDPLVQGVLNNVVDQANSLIDKWQLENPGAKNISPELFKEINQRTKAAGLQLTSAHLEAGGIKLPPKNQVTIVSSKVNATEFDRLSSELVNVQTLEAAEKSAEAARRTMVIGRGIRVKEPRSTNLHRPAQQAAIVMLDDTAMQVDIPAYFSANTLSSDPGYTRAATATKQFTTNVNIAKNLSTGDWYLHDGNYTIVAAFDKLGNVIEKPRQ